MNPSLLKALEIAGMPEWDWNRTCRLGFKGGLWHIDEGGPMAGGPVLAEYIAEALIERHFREWLEKRGPVYIEIEMIAGTRQYRITTGKHKTGWHGNCLDALIAAVLAAMEGEDQCDSN